ncbi:MAG: DUF916 domain-containing protein [Coriobacteriales bacterium]|jgi:hypothetical protein|nr:DUF916 domain-containing protein [Coriobacteriales bacterium]
MSHLSIKRLCHSLVATTVALFMCAALCQAAFAAPKDAHADDRGVTVSPVKLNLKVKAGERSKGSFTVINNSDKAGNISVYAAPFGVSDMTYENTDFTTQTTYTKLSDWIKFPRSVYHFKGNEQKKIEFRVDCPAGTAPGGQYAALFAQIDPPKQGGAQSGISAARRVGCLVYGEVAGKTVRDGQVDFGVLPLFHFGGKLDCAFRVQNSGNIDFDTDYQLIATPIFLGEAYDSLDPSGKAFADPANPPISKRNVLPGTTRAVTQTWAEPAFGVYDLSELVNYNGEFKTNTHRIFVCPPWAIVTAVLVLALLVMLCLVLPLHRRKRRSLQNASRAAARAAQLAQDAHAI